MFSLWVRFLADRGEGSQPSPWGEKRLSQTVSLALQRSISPPRTVSGRLRSSRDTVTEANARARRSPARMQRTRTRRARASSRRRSPSACPDRTPLWRTSREVRGLATRRTRGGHDPRGHRAQSGLGSGAALAGFGVVGVFERRGNPYDPNSVVKRDFARTLRRAGLPKIRFHDLRHTYAASLIAAGAHPKYIQAQLGHASITTTLNTCGHLLPKEFRGESDRLSQLVFGVTSEIYPPKKRGHQMGTVPNTPTVNRAETPVNIGAPGGI
jgi:hypothetical protein